MSSWIPKRQQTAVENTPEKTRLQCQNYAHKRYRHPDARLTCGHLAVDEEEVQVTAATIPSLAAYHEWHSTLPANSAPHTDLMSIMHDQTRIPNPSHRLLELQSPANPLLPVLHRLRPIANIEIASTAGCYASSRTQDRHPGEAARDRLL